MWYSLTKLIINRPFLTGQKEKLVRFAKHFRNKFSIISKEYGDDVSGLELTADPNELYINSYHFNNFVEDFEKVNGDFFTIKKLKQVNDSLGLLSYISEISPTDRITESNEFDTDEEKTKLFHELAQLNERRDEIIKKLLK